MIFFFKKKPNLPLVIYPLVSLMVSFSFFFFVENNIGLIHDHVKYLEIKLYNIFFTNTRM